MRMILATLLSTAMFVATAAGAVFADTQPTQGYSSTRRNDAGFGGGPHCHVNVIASEHNPTVEFVEVFPSHTAHVHSGLPGDIFQADPNCDGDPGN